MTQFWKVVNEVIARSDIILEILDARFPELSQNEELEEKVKRADKQLIYVINKCDLVPKESVEKWKRVLKPSVFVSTKMMYGTTILRDKILRYSKNDKVTVGVVGYPNTGKSSVINALKGKKSAPTSSVSGFTKGLQMVKVDNRIMILDTPGVLPFKEQDEVKHALLGSKSMAQIKDPEYVASKLIELHIETIIHHYKISNPKNGDHALELIAQSHSMIKKGGVPDTIRSAKKVLDDWQTGKIILTPYSSGEKLP